MTVSIGAPAIVLVRPQLGQNIGMAARAMLNCGLADLRLVAPRDGWPSEDAVAAASGADDVVHRARVYETTEAAVADCNFVLATTARSRDMVKPVFTAKGAAEALAGHSEAGGSPAVLFGPERSGLENDDVALADGIVTVPLNPGFTSLNLAQSVLLVAYEWFQLADARAAERPDAYLRHGESRPATRAELVNLLQRLEHALDTSGFLRVAKKRPIMVRQLRNIFTRAGLTEQEVNTLHGVITSLWKAAPPRDLDELAGRGPPASTPSNDEDA